LFSFAEKKGGGNRGNGKKAAIIVGGGAALGFAFIFLLFVRSWSKKEDDWTKIGPIGSFYSTRFQTFMIWAGLLKLVQLDLLFRPDFRHLLYLVYFFSFFFWLFFFFFGFFNWKYIAIISLGWWTHCKNTANAFGWCTK